MVLAGREARVDHGGAPARAQRTRRGLGRSARHRRLSSPCLPPGKTYQQHALARGVWLTSCRPSVRGWRSGPVPMRSVLYGRWASRRSPVGRNRPVPQCHGWCRSPRHMRSLCSSCTPLAEDLRHTRSPSTTAPHRPADASRFVPIAGGEIELALLCATAQGTMPASGKARCARCARRDCPGAPLGGATPLR